MDQEKEREEEEEEEKAENVEMAGQDAGVGDHFFDGEEDDGQVDMAIVFEAMKHVPLPDVDYAESDDTSPAELEDFPAQAAGPRASELDPSKASIKGTAGTGGAGHVKKKGGSRGRVSKRVKGTHNGKDNQERGSSKDLFSISRNWNSVERSTTATTATAAKVAAEVAAEVAPNVVTGGVVAEIGPRPDFSLWTVEDDLLLKNAMEAGAAVEALAKGAMRFSRRYSVRELRERWRALLYDPEISAQAAARMVEAEAALNIVPLKPKTPNDRKKLQNLERKRRLHSIRTLYYKNRKKMAAEKLMSVTESQILDDREDGEDGVADEVHGEAGGRSVLVPLDMMTLEAGDPNFIEGPLSPKAPDYEDRTFTEMFSLLAAGGVGAVFGPLPGGSSLDTAEEEHKAGQESQSGFNSVQAKATHLPESSVFISEPTEGDAVVQGDPKFTARAVTSEEANMSTHDTVGPGEESLQFPAGQNPKQEPVEENNNVTQLQSNNHALYEKSATKDAGHVEGGCTTPSIGNFEVSSREGSPVGKELLNSLPADTFLKSDYLGKANGEREAPSKVEEPSCKTSVTTNLSIVRTESMVENPGAVSNKELECCTQTMDPPCSLLKEPVRVAVADRSETPEDNVSLTAECKTGDTEEEDYDPLHVHWKQRQLKADGDVGGAHDGSLEEFNESEVEGDSDGMLYDRHVKELDEGVGDDSLYRTDSGEALDLHNSSMLYSTEIEYVHRAATDLVLMDPVFGPLVCTFNTEDTEVPSTDEALPLPSVGSPLFTASELGDEEDIEDDNNIYYTSGEDEADIPGSPTDLQVYEESESPDTVGVMVESGNIESTQPTIGASKAGIKIKVGGSVQVCGPRHEGENLWEPRTAAANPAKSAGDVFQSSIPPPVDGVSGPCDLHDSRLEEDAGSPRSDTDGGQHSRGSPSISETSLPEYSGAQPGLHEAEVEVCAAELDPIAKQEAQAGAEGDAAELKTGGEASGCLQIEEEEPESEAEMARFSDVETMIMNMDLDPGADDEFSALAESRRMYRQQHKALVRLEQGMEAAMQRALTKRKALAILYGRHLRFYMTKTQVSMGRMTQDNVVDIDLGKEGRANKVSRQQAFMKLKADGVFYLKNLGRRSLTVNNIAIDTGQRAILGSNCLIEVGGMRFIFEINKRLVKQQTEIMQRSS